MKKNLLLPVIATLFFAVGGIAADGSGAELQSPPAGPSDEMNASLKEQISKLQNEAALQIRQVGARISSNLNPLIQKIENLKLDAVGPKIDDAVDRLNLAVQGLDNPANQSLDEPIRRLDDTVQQLDTLLQTQRLQAGQTALHQGPSAEEWEELKRKMESILANQEQPGNQPVGTLLGWIGVGLAGGALVLLGILYGLLPWRRHLRQLNVGGMDELKQGLAAIQNSVEELLKRNPDERLDELKRAIETVPQKSKDKISPLFSDQTKKNESTWTANLKALFGGKMDEGQKSLANATNQLQRSLEQLGDKLRELDRKKDEAIQREADANRRLEEANRKNSELDGRIQAVVQERTDSLRQELQGAKDERARTVEALNKTLQANERGVREELAALVNKLAQTERELGTFQQRIVQDNQAHQAAMAAKQKELEDAKASVETRVAEEKERIAQTLAAQNETRLEESRAAATDARKRLEDAVSAHASETAGLQAKIDETTMALNQAHAETQSTKTELAAEKAAGEAARAEAASQLERQRKATQEALDQIEALRGRSYPAEFMGHDGFAPLRDQLEDWSGRQVPGAEIAKAGLMLFANRTRLDDQIWQAALRDISIGLALALSNEGASEKLPAELTRWAKFLLAFSEAPAQFTLKIPTIGSRVDRSWMNYKGVGVTVNKVFSWAVYGDMGIAYPAKVE